MKYLVCLLLLMSSGCQTMVYGTASSFSELNVGMTKPQVIEKLGEPASIGVDSEKNEEYLTYKKMRHAISMWPKTYVLTLKSGKLTKWGEQIEN